MIAHLPLAVLRAALAFLSVEELLANVTVCRRWMRWISHPEALPRTFVPCSRRIREWMYAQGVRWHLLHAMGHLGIGPQQAAFVTEAWLSLSDITSEPDRRLRPRKLTLFPGGGYDFRLDWMKALLSEVEDLHYTDFEPPVFNPLPLCKRLTSLRIYAKTSPVWPALIRAAPHSDFTISVRIDTRSHRETIDTLANWLPLAARIRRLALVISDPVPHRLIDFCNDAPHELVRMLRRFRLCEFHYKGSLPFLPLDAVPHLSYMCWGPLHMNSRRAVERFLTLLPEIHYKANDVE